MAQHNTKRAITCCDYCQASVLRYQQWYSTLPLATALHYGRRYWNFICTFKLADVLVPRKEGSSTRQKPVTTGAAECDITTALFSDSKMSCHFLHFCLFFHSLAATFTWKRQWELLTLQALSPVHTSNNVEATFDFVAKNGNDVERLLRWNFVISTKSNVASTLLPKTATLSKQQATSVASTMLLVWTGLMWWFEHS